MGLTAWSQTYAESTAVINAMQFVYSPFQQMAALPYPAADECTILYGGLVYVIGGSCMPTEQSRTVPPAGTWTMNNVYLYCRDLDSIDDISGLPVTVTVTYSDEHGVTGKLTRSAPAGAVR